MSKSYEELVGAIGRSVYFRPERRRVRELLSRDAEPTLQIGEKRYRLFDVSLNGVSFNASAAEGKEFTVGSEVDVGVLVHHDPLFFGRARIARVEEVHGGARVGLALLTGILDLPEFHRRDEESRLTRELNGGPDSLRKLVPVEYRAFIEKASTFFQFYRQAFDRHESRYRGQAAGAQTAIDTLVHRGIESLRSSWTAIESEGSEIAKTFLSDPARLQAAKKYTELLITPLMMGAPMFSRSYRKPLGYPGDYQTMLYCYENHPEGPTAFDRILHTFCVEHPLASGIRTRKDLVVDALAEELAKSIVRRGKEPFRATSLGCGPAREIADFVRSRKQWPGSIHWTLLDQEEEALSIAYQTGTRALTSASSKGSLECMHIAFSQLLTNPALFPDKQPQDLIYSVGLFDYLKESKAQEIVTALYERLNRGGLLLIGNALGPNNHFWSLEFPTDWTLLYRTKEEMRRLGAKLPSNAELEVKVDPSNAYYFLAVRKA